MTRRQFLKANAPASVTLGGIRGGSLIAATAAIAAALSLLAQIFAERAFGPAGFAQWAFLNATLALLVPIACMGSNHLLLSRALSAWIEGPRGRQLLALHFVVFAVIAAATMGMMVDSLAPSGVGGFAMVALYVLLFAHIPVNLAFPVFQSQARVAWVAGWPLVQVGVKFAAVIAAIAWPIGVGGAFVVWAVAVVALAIAGSAFLCRHLGASARRDVAPVDQSWREQQRRVSTAGIGFGLNDLAESLDIKLFVPMAAWLTFASTTSLAVAGLVTVLLSAVQFFPWVLVTRVLLPAIHAQSEGSRQQVAQLVTKMSTWAMVVLLPFAFVFYFLGFEALDRVVSGDYRSEREAVSWVGAAFVPLCVSQFVVAPHMASTSTWQLFRWRMEGLAIFVSVAFVGRSLGLAALVIGFAAGRTWLGIRAWNALHVGRCTS